MFISAYNHVILANTQFAVVVICVVVTCQPNNPGRAECAERLNIKDYCLCYVLLLCLLFVLCFVLLLLYVCCVVLCYVMILLVYFYIIVCVCMQKS